MAKAKAKNKGKKKGKQAKLSRGKKKARATKSKARKGGSKKKAAKKRISAPKRMPAPEPVPSMGFDTTPEVPTFPSDTAQERSMADESPGPEETSYSEISDTDSSSSSM
jgi:hypothetical protein